MDVLEQMRTWLAAYPGWESVLFTDSTEAKPDNLGLFPGGMEILRRWQDVTGTVFSLCRYRFTLRRVCKGPGAQSAGAFLDFARWVRLQSEGGLTPRFGDVAKEERMTAQNGRLEKLAQTGTAVYATDLVAEFMKIN